MAASEMISDLAAHSLDLVSREIGNTLEAARRDLEDLIDGQAGREALSRAADLLHLARGALKIIELHGASMLAEEMEEGCRHAAGLGDKESLESCLEVITRAMVQLPAYLDRLQSGGRDVALVLLPLLNDLRQMRGKASLSEGSLLLLNAGPYELHAATKVSEAVDAEASRRFQLTARKLRPAFQNALLHWIKGESTAEHLDKLARASATLENAASTDPVRQLWFVLTGVLGAIASGDLEASVTLKRLVGQADRQLKRLIDAGEAAWMHEPPVDLLNSLLYYVGRAGTRTARIRAIRELYRLDEFMPGEEQIESVREGLAGPSVKLMRTVAQAIKEDLASVKDALDIFVRTGMEDIEQLKPQLEMLKKIGDTLGVLGLDQARVKIQRESQALENAVAGVESADAGALERTAATLLDVEDVLDRELVRAVLPDGAAGNQDEGEVQYRHVTQAVIGECIVNLAKIKEVVTHVIDSAEDRRRLEEVKPQLRGITAGLLMLNKTKAVKIVERIGRVIETRLGQQEKPLRPEHLERLADAIVSVEYFMETVSLGRADPLYMLDNASRCLALLEALPPVRPMAAVVPVAPAAPAVPAAPGPVVEPGSATAGADSATGAGPAAGRGSHTAPGASDAHGPSDVAGVPDVEPGVAATPSLSTGLGAAAPDTSRAPTMSAAPAASATPASFSGSAPAPQAASDAPAPIAPAASPAAKPPKPLAPVMKVEEDRSDPELLELFIEEAKEEIEVIRRFLPIWAQRPDDSDALISVRRSFHTLKGSGRMVGAQRIGEFAWSVENLLNRLINQTLQASPAIAALIAEAAAALPQLIEQLESGIKPSVDVDGLMQRIEAVAAGKGEPLERPKDALQLPTPERELGQEATDTVAPGSAEDSVGPGSAEDSAVSGSAADSVVWGSVEGDVVQVQGSAEESPKAWAPIGMDPVLTQIFVTEMLGHLDTIRAFLADAEKSMPPRPVDEPLYRAWHTLLGSARMAGFEPAVLLARPLSELLGRRHDAGMALGVEGLDALRAAADEVERMAAALTGGTGFAASGGLVERLEALAAQSPQSNDAAEQGAQATSSSDSTAPDAVAVSDESGAAPDEPDAAPEASMPPAAPAAAFDPEVAAIFAEEATEILDNAELALQALQLAQQAGGPSSEGLVELQRLLHTLKGGARMAGATAMGDLSHALETLLAGMASGRVAPSFDALRLIQQCLDRLHQMRDGLDAGKVVAVPADLLHGLEQFAAGRSSAAEVADTLSSEPSSAPGDARQNDVEVQAAPAGEGQAAPAGAEHAAPVDAGAAHDAATAAEAGPSSVVSSPSPSETPSQQLSSAASPPPSGVDASPASPHVSPPADVPRAAASNVSPSAPFDVSSATGANVSPATGANVPSTAASSLPSSAASNASSTALPAAPSTSAAPERAETARVDAGLLDQLLNGAGEVSIFQSRLKQQLHSVEFHLGELGQTVTRLREQLRKLEAETEAQILHRHQGDVATDQAFDPLELDRYSTIQQLSRALAETASDVASINELLQGLTTEADTLLTQQAHVTSDLQEGLMQTRMVPFQRHVSRLARIVRQAASETGKAAELVVEGASNELDRQVLDNMLAPFEHLVRNAVVHGIEKPEIRTRAGKPETGKVTIKLRREGSEVLVEVADDGAGLNLDAIRRKAYEQGIIRDPRAVSDQEAVELILRPGFSTAGELTQSAGRGVGMDVVDNEIKKLGGSMRIESTPGNGVHFLMRLPFTLAITHALIVNAGEETFALPLPTIEGVARMPREQLLELLTQDDPKLDHGDVGYRIQHLGALVGGMPSALSEEESAVSLVLVRAGESSAALLTDSLEGSREIVVKTLGPHIASVAGVSGATILGDGRIVMILDVATLVRSQRGAHPSHPPVAAPAARQVIALVVDDSITMRRVTQRFLERRGVKVLTARDGLDAIDVLQDQEVDIILLDIEMPRMDGYQFATHVRNDEKLRDLPIIMITSRSGEKHRAKAIEIGVNDYLSKPYQEAQLIGAIEGLIGRPV